MMRELEHDEKGDTHVYECKPWTEADELHMLAGDPLVKLACVYCAAPLCSYQFTAERCKMKGHHALCPNCMEQLKGEQGHKFKDAGYIRGNKLERIQ